MCTFPAEKRQQGVKNLQIKNLRKRSFNNSSEISTPTALCELKQPPVISTSFLFLYVVLFCLVLAALHSLNLINKNNCACLLLFFLSIIFKCVDHFPDAPCMFRLQFMFSFKVNRVSTDHWKFMNLKKKKSSRSWKVFENSYA